MILQLLKSCTLGHRGVLIDVTLTRASELIRSGIAREHAAAPRYERKVVQPEIKEQAAKRKKPKPSKKDQS